MLEFVEKCWNLSEYVGKCRNLSEFVKKCQNLAKNVGKCRKISEFVGNVGICRDMELQHQGSMLETKNNEDPCKTWGGVYNDGN